jgi:hypothetical protein
MGSAVCGGSFTHGTLLNSQQNKGKGPQPLKPGYVISPAGVVDLVFKAA